MIIKFVVVLSGMAMAILLAGTVFHGRGLRRDRSEGSKHIRFARMSFWAMLLLIFSAEVMVRMSTGYKMNELFLVHLTFSTLFAASLTVNRFWITGRKNPKIHKLLAYSCCSFFLIMAVTGGILMAGLKMK